MKNLLTNVTDVAEVRTELLEQQEGKDDITGLEIPQGKSVLDHDHSDDLVRGVLHRNVNSMIGRIENAYHRELGWWYSDKLSDFLRKTADYLDKENLPVYHPSWIATVIVQFNKLNATQQNKVLHNFGTKAKKQNLLERRKAMRALMVKKLITKGEALEEILGVKESS